ncbi:MAG: hypothetical protein ACRDJU_04910 [Actinomycetota bacterium]
MRIRTWVVGGLVAAMAVTGPAAAWAGGGHDGGGDGGNNSGLLGGNLLGGNLLGGNLGGILGNGCADNALVSIGGDGPAIDINLSGDLDLNHALVTTGDRNVGLLSVGGSRHDNGLLNLLGNEDLLGREGLLGVATQCQHDDW